MTRKHWASTTLGAVGVAIAVNIDGVSPALYLDWPRDSRAFESLGAMAGQFHTITPAAAPRGAGPPDGRDSGRIEPQ